MKALLLVGGLGTRLHPLTLTTPKPLVPFANVSILERILHSLAKAGITKAVLAVSYRMKDFEIQKEKLERATGCSIQIARENALLGTGGAVKNVERLLDGDDFVVVNADIVCDVYPFREIVHEHRTRGNRITILAVPSQTPERYGVLVVDADTNRVVEFVEKPAAPVSRLINGGIYVFRPDILQLLPENIRFMLETAVFPVLAKKREIGAYLYSSTSWFDVGTVEDYKRATVDYMRRNGLRHKKVVGKGTVVGRTKKWKYSLAGSGCTIRALVVVNTVIFDSTRIERQVYLSNSVIGNRCRIGKYAVVKNSVIGDGVFVPAFSYVVGERISLDCTGSTEHVAADGVRPIEVDVDIEAGNIFGSAK